MAAALNLVFLKYTYFIINMLGYWIFEFVGGGKQIDKANSQASKLRFLETTS